MTQCEVQSILDCDFIYEETNMGMTNLVSLLCVHGDTLTLCFNHTQGDALYKFFVPAVKNLLKGQFDYIFCLNGNSFIQKNLDQELEFVIKDSSIFGGEYLVSVDKVWELLTFRNEN